MKLLSIIRIDYVMAYDSKKISTSRILAGEIDRQGNKIQDKKPTKI